MLRLLLVPFFLCPGWRYDSKLDKETRIATTREQSNRPVVQNVDVQGSFNVRMSFATDVEEAARTGVAVTHGKQVWIRLNVSKRVPLEEQHVSHASILRRVPF